LYLPGNECLAKLVSGQLPGGATTTTTTLPPENPDETVPPAEPPPKPVLKAIPSDTTIPPDVLDPRAPVPTIPISGGTVVYQCDKPPAGVVITGKKKP
jgi:hypothetical protein